MPDLASIPLTSVVALVAVAIWALVRESRILQTGRRGLKDALDIAVPVVAVAAIVHGFLTSDRDDGPLSREEPLQAETSETEQLADPEHAAAVGEDPLLAVATDSSQTTAMSDSALLAAALGAFQDATQVPSSSRVRVAAPLAPQSAAPAPAPAPVVTRRVTQHTPVATAVTQSQSNTEVVAVLPLDGRKPPERDHTAVVVSSNGTGLIVTQKGPVVVARHYENPAFRSLRSCPDESCEIVANLSRFAPLTRTGKRHAAGYSQQNAWVEVRSPGPHCKRYDSSSMTGACLEWQRSTVTGWTRDPNLIR